MCTQSKTGTNKNPLANRRGISLIETLVCIGILMAAVFGSATAIVKASYATNEDRHRWDASQVGSLVLEQLVYAYISNGLLNQGVHNQYFMEDFTPVAAVGPSAPAPGSYFYNVQWTVYQNTPVSGVYDIQLIVSWTERGSLRQVAFETYR
jgi:hypothetical protein